MPSAVIPSPPIASPSRLLACCAIAVLAAGPCRAAAPTLCTADEMVVFSCSTGAHIASICASQDLSAHGGTLQYRYGVPTQVDLAFPEAGVSPKDAFTSGTMMFSGGGGAWLRFRKGPFSYTIFSAIGKWGPSDSAVDASGVAIQKDGRAFANFKCRAPGNGEMGRDFFDKAGLTPAAGADDFEIPDAFFPK